MAINFISYVNFRQHWAIRTWLKYATGLLGCVSIAKACALMQLL